MRRFVSLSAAVLLAVGTVAGAAQQNTAQAAYRGSWSSAAQQGMDKDEILRYLFEKFDIWTGGESPVQKPGAGSGSTQKPGADGGSVQQPGQGSGSSSQSSFASQVVSLVNAERAKYGLSSLTMDSRVAAAAQVRAGELYRSFSHTRPDGRSCFTALSEAGASYRGAGENIAYGQSSPQAVMQAWMNSSSHRANILSNKYTKIGVGYTVKNGTAYWTQMFAY